MAHGTRQVSSLRQEGDAVAWIMNNGRQPPRHSFFRKSPVCSAALLSFWRCGIKGKLKDSWGPNVSPSGMTPIPTTSHPPMSHPFHPLDLPTPPLPAHLLSLPASLGCSRRRNVEAAGSPSCFYLFFRFLILVFRIIISFLFNGLHVVFILLLSFLTLI